SQMIPPLQGLLAALGLKLWSIERKSHVMALVADEGLGLFCGLNAMPKKSFLSEYSSRITPEKVAILLGTWHHQLAGGKLLPGHSSNLSSNRAPFLGAPPAVAPHYPPNRSRPPPSSFPSPPQDAESDIFCSSTADTRRGKEADEISRFTKSGPRQHGSQPQHL